MNERIQRSKLKQNPEGLQDGVTDKKRKKKELTKTGEKKINQIGKRRHKSLDHRSRECPQQEIAKFLEVWRVIPH